MHACRAVGYPKKRNSGKGMVYVDCPSLPRLRAETPVSGFRRARTLWTRQAVPDDQQPAWDLFHWGGAVPTEFLGWESRKGP